MQRINHKLILAIFVILVFHTISTIGQEEQEKKAWTGRFPNGTLMTKAHLNRILEEHKIWLDSEGKKGKRADLGNTDLGYARLFDTNLKDANFSGVNLEKTFYELKSSQHKGLLSNNNG